MLPSDDNAFTFVICTLVAMIVCPIIFTAPALADCLNFTETGQIGDTIGGITAPIVGLCSVILLYYTLKEQMNFNKSQSKDNKMTQLLGLQSDIIQMNERVKFSFKNASSELLIEASGVCSLSLLEKVNDYKPYMELCQYRYLNEELKVFLELCCHYFNYLNSAKEHEVIIAESEVVRTYFQELERFWEKVIADRVSVRVGMMDNYKDSDGKDIMSEIDDLKEDAQKSLDKINCYKSNK